MNLHMKVSEPSGQGARGGADDAGARARARVRPRACGAQEEVCLRPYCILACLGEAIKARDKRRVMRRHVMPAGHVSTVDSLPLAASASICRRRIATSVPGERKHQPSSLPHAPCLV